MLSWDNALRLTQFVKGRNIKNVLELGTGIGCSASVLALALPEAKIHTVEQFDKCIKIANDLIPVELKKNITIYKSDVVVWQTPENPYQNLMNFKDIPVNDYDLILVDGPGPFLEDGKLIELPNGDVFKLLIEGKIKPGAVVVWDKRLLALSIIERYYSDNFYLVKPLKDTRLLNFLERKDNPLQRNDTRQRSMERMGYFKDL